MVNNLEPEQLFSHLAMISPKAKRSKRARPEPSDALQDLAQRLIKLGQEQPEPAAMSPGRAQEESKPDSLTAIDFKKPQEEPVPATPSPPTPTRPTASDDDSNPVHDVSLNPSGRRNVCSTCHRVFPTGQALGGHMRKHYKRTIEAAKIGESGSSDDGSCGNNSSGDVTKSDDSGARSIRDFDLNLPPPEEPEFVVYF